MVVVYAIPSYSLEPPYLIRITAQSTRSVNVEWRITDMKTSAFIIDRREVGQQHFSHVSPLIDTIQNTSIYNYSDTGLEPGTGYEYGILAVNGDDTSTLSQIDSVRTVVSVLKKPVIKAEFNMVELRLTITVYDSSDNEDVYDVYRATDDGKPVLVSHLKSGNPSETGNVYWDDESYVPNTWYVYSVKAVKGTDTLEGDYSSHVFTLEHGKIVHDDDSLVVLGGCRSMFPIKWRNWAWKDRDTIFTAESSFDEFTYSKINVSDPEKPIFKGTGRSNFSINQSDPYGYGERQAGIFIDSLFVLTQQVGASVADSFYLLKNDGLNFEMLEVSVCKSKYDESTNGVHHLSVISNLGDSALVFIAKYAFGMYDFGYNAIGVMNFRQDVTSPDFIRYKGVGGRYSEIMIHRCFNGIVFMMNSSGESMLYNSRVNAIVEVPFESKRIPNQVGKYITFDTTLINADQVFFDSSKKLVYLLKLGKSMSIYNYSLESGAQRNSIRRLTGKVNSGNRLVNGNNTVEYDLLGRRIQQNSFTKLKRKFGIIIVEDQGKIRKVIGR